MPIWSPVIYIVLLSVIYYFAREPQKELPVLINGLIPSEPGAKTKDKSGTTVLVCYADMDPKNPESEIFRGYADEEGNARSNIPKSDIGKEVLIRIRHAAYKFQDFKMKIPRYGIIYTAKMEKDGVYNGSIRGAEVGDPDKHFAKAVSEADSLRLNAANVAREFGRSLAQIPIIIWAIAYLGIILANSFDYHANGMCFHGHLESFAQALYFSVVTITTLGYGDFYPIDNIFRMMVSLEAIFGVLVVGLFLNSLFYERK